MSVSGPCPCQFFETAPCPSRVLRVTIVLSTYNFKSQLLKMAANDNGKQTREIREEIHRLLNLIKLNDDSMKFKKSRIDNDRWNSFKKVSYIMLTH